MRQRDILRFWAPLFASWLLMTAEGPTISAAINRLPDEEMMLRAAGVVISLSVLIESPILNLLATATALVRDRQSYLQVRRFTIHWMIGLTIVTFLVAFTPLFDLVVGGLMGIRGETADWVLAGMRIMSLWSAAIAWRRFLQGVMIHFNRTQLVARGTLVRLVSVAITAVALVSWGRWPGIYVGGAAWMVGVITEALYATWAIRPLLRDELREQALDDIKVAPDAEGALTYRELFWFHLPLAGTSVLLLMTQPLITASLARLDNADLNLAAWPLVFQILLMMRAGALALPETIIALNRDDSQFHPLRRFSLIITGAVVFTMAAFIFSPIARLYLAIVQDATADVTRAALGSMTLFLLIPALTTLVSWLRGLLIGRRATGAVNAGMAANLLATIIGLGAGLLLRLDGMATAAVALTAALLVEFVYLYWRTGRIVQVPLFGRQPVMAALPAD